MPIVLPHHAIAMPLLADIDAKDAIGYGIGLLGLCVAVAAIWLAIRHARALSQVQEAMKEAQDGTKRNLLKTEEVGHQTLEALSLHEALVGHGDLAKSMNDLATDYVDVLDLGDQFFRKRANQDIDQARTYVHMAAEGQLAIGPEALAADEEIPCALLEVTQPGDQFWASSVVSPAFWARAAAYLQLQKERIDAGVEIKRVFIFKNKKSFEDKHAQRQLRLQVEKGILVHVAVDPEETARDLVALARPTPETNEGGPATDNLNGTPEKRVPDILYAAEFSVAAGRVANIHLWSSAAGHGQRVTRMWNILNGFYNDSEAMILDTNGLLTKAP